MLSSHADFIGPMFYVGRLEHLVLVETGCQKFIEPVLSLLRYKINLVGIDLLYIY